MSYGDESYEDLDHRKKPSGSGRGTCLLVIFIGGGLSVLLVCCGGGGGLVWFGMHVISAEIENQLRDNKVLQEHVGVIESFSMDFTRTAAENDSDTMVFRVKGSQGEGIVTVVSDTAANGEEQIRSAVLRLPDGKEVPLVP